LIVKFQPVLFIAAGLGLALTSALAATPLARAESAASSAPKDKGQCFYARNINNYVVAGDRLVYIRVGVGDVWRLDLMNDCPEIAFRQHLEFTRFDPSAFICSPIDLTIRFHQTGVKRICPVSDMHKLTAPEIAALPKRDRP
jgi:hypothetical protein